MILTVFLLHKHCDFADAWGIESKYSAFFFLIAKASNGLNEGRAIARPSLFFG